MLWPWKERQTFEFFVQKRPGADAGTTDARYYIFDLSRKAWRHSATINCPDGGHESVTTLGGGLNSFLENFADTEKQVPKLALYRLWLGPSLEQMKPLTRAQGDGEWGQLHDAYFLAEGDGDKLKTLFAQLEPDYGKPTFGGKEKTLDPLSDRPVARAVIEAMKQLQGRQRAAEFFKNSCNLRSLRRHYLQRFETSAG